MYKRQQQVAHVVGCFVGAEAPDYVGDLLSATAVERAGVFDPAMVTALHTKLSRQVADSSVPGSVSNADNMALVGILSVQLLHHRLIDPSGAASAPSDIVFDVDVTAATSSTSGSTHAR